MRDPHEFVGHEHDASASDGPPRQRDRHYPYRGLEEKTDWHALFDYGLIAISALFALWYWSTH